MKLLVIDDQEAVCNIVAQIAAQGGWDCIYSTESEDLLSMIDKEKVDVLLIDYLMPGMDGIEATRALRKNGKNLPVILFSGLAEEIDAALAKELNILNILEKPLDIAELRRTLSNASTIVSQSK